MRFGRIICLKVLYTAFLCCLAYSKGYGQIVSSNTDSAIFYYEMAVARYLKDDDQMALHYCNKALQFNNKNVDALTLKGTLYVVKAKVDDLSSYYDSALVILSKIDEKNADARVYLAKGDAEFYLEKYDKSINDYNNCLKFDPSDKYAHKFLGLSYYYLDSLDSAITHLQKAIEIKDDSKIYFFMGSCFMKKRELVSAKKYYEKSIQLGANVFQSFRDLGVLEQERGNFLEAEEYARSALKISPNSFQANGNLVQALLSLGKTVEILEPSLKLIEKKPDDEMANFFTGLAYAFKKDSTNGLYFLNKAITISNNRPDFVERRGLFLMELKCYSKALDDILFCYNKGLAIHGIEYYIARCYQELGDMEQAKKYYQEVLNMNPEKLDFGIMEVYASYGSFMLLSGNIDTAEIYLNKCLDIEPFYPEARYGMAKIELIKGNFDGLISNSDLVLKQLRLQNVDTNVVIDFINELYFLRAVGCLLHDKNEIALENINKVNPRKETVLAKKNFYTELIYINEGKIDVAIKHLEGLEQNRVFESNDLSGLKLVLLMYSNNSSSFTELLITVLQSNSNNPYQLTTLFPESDYLDKRIISKGLTFSKRMEKDKFFFRVTSDLDKDFFKNVHKKLEQINKSDKVSKESKEAQLMVEELIK